MAKAIGNNNAAAMELFRRYRFRMSAFSNSLVLRSVTRDYPLRQPSRRAGRNKMARSKANTAPTVIQTTRSGREISQINGSKTRTTSASGQLIARRMHHATKKMSTFMLVELFLHDFRGRQPPLAGVWLVVSTQPE